MGKNLLQWNCWLGFNKILEIKAKMKKCKERVKSARKIIEKLYEVDTNELCLDDIIMLQKLLKVLRKRADSKKE